MAKSKLVTEEILEKESIETEVTEKNEKKKKKQKKAKKPSYFKEVGIELKKSTFPSFKDVMKYTAATIVFCGVLVIFFVLLNLLLSVVKGLF